MTQNYPQPNPNPSRIDELLADRAVSRLDDGDAAELQRLLHAAGRAEDESLDLAAAALDLAMHPAELNAELPARLLAELDHDGAAWCAGVNAAGESVAGRIGPEVHVHGRETRSMRTPMVMGKRYLRDWSGWMAAAACLAFGVYAWNNRASVNPGASKPITAGIGGELVESLKVKALDRINHWFNSGSEVEVVSLGTAKPEASPGDVSLGEVFWNKCDRNGVLRVTGLPPSKPDQVYQLWVYDRSRDTRYPVEGGRLRVEEGQTKVVIPIDPHMPVDDATLFAVTIEPERGTVVSQGEMLIGIGVPQGKAPPPVFEPDAKK